MIMIKKITIDIPELNKAKYWKSFKEKFIMSLSTTKRSRGI